MFYGTKYLTPYSLKEQLDKYFWLYILGQHLLIYLAKI